MQISVAMVVGSVWMVALPSRVVLPLRMIRATLPATSEVATHQELSVPASVKEFVRTMKSLASRETAPYRERIVPENPKADLSKILAYVGANGIEFVDFDNAGIRDAQRTTIRPIARERLAKQIQARKGEQLLWLMELAHFFKWWVDKPNSIGTPDPGVLVVTFREDYELTFREQPTGLQLIRLKSLRDADGGV